MELGSRSDSKMYAFNHDIKFVLHILLNLVLDIDRLSLSEKTTKHHSACTIFFKEEEEDKDKMGQF